MDEKPKNCVSCSNHFPSVNGVFCDKVLDENELTKRKRIPFNEYMYTIQGWCPILEEED